MVDFTYMTGPGTPRGAQMFNEMLEHFGSNVIGVRGSWAGGGELSTNFDVYKAAIGRNLSPEEAAALTPTGKNATRAGFGKINIFTDNENEVLLEFTR
ncbi:MAG: hypothetical protein MUF31_10185 [Akkermansiaceae bacterium]|jgi:hypothetical protein|nr:hypothetical protein [Akkermansiaceae bacterium]